MVVLREVKAVDVVTRTRGSCLLRDVKYGPMVIDMVRISFCVPSALSLRSSFFLLAQPKDCEEARVTLGFKNVDNVPGLRFTVSSGEPQRLLFFFVFFFLSSADN